MKSPVLIVSLILLTSSSYVLAQRGQIQTDTSVTGGYIFLSSKYDNNRQVSFARNKKSAPILYYPKDLAGYSILSGSGTVFTTRNVQENQTSVPYFLLTAGQGTIKTYALKNDKGSRFFIEDSVRFIELDKTTFREVLTDFQGSCKNENAANRVRFNQKSLARFANLTNMCYSGYFPRSRFGIAVGYVSTNMTVKGYYGENVELQGESGLTLGLTFDAPLSLKKPGWYLAMQALFKNYTFTSVPNSISELEVKTSMLTLPVLIKYKSNDLVFRPYVTAGPALQLYLNSSNTVTGINIELEPFKPIKYAAQVGVGAEFSLGNAVDLGIEGQYIRGKDDQVTNNTFQILFSVFF